MKDGERLKARREQLGLTLEEVAKMMNTSRQNIHRYEAKETMRSDVLYEFAKVYKTHPAFLAGFITEEQAVAELEADAIRSAFLAADENIRAAVRKLLDVEAAK